ncbi:hypothetical protein Tco_1568132 [Tanacetum coccineum]
MIDYLSIVETDKMIHTVETDMVKLVVEIECFGMSFDEFDKDTGSSDGLQSKQADMKMSTRVVTNTNEVYNGGNFLYLPEFGKSVDVAWDRNWIDDD